MVSTMVIEQVRIPGSNHPETNQNIFPGRQEPTLTNILFSSQDLTLESLLSKTKSDNS
jgi:hypothetical protein